MNNNLTSTGELANEVLPQDWGNFEHIFHPDNHHHYRNAIDTTADLVQEFLYRNTKPFSGIEAKEMKGKVQEIDLNQKLSSYSELLSEVDDIYVKHATAFHLPQYVAHLNCPVVIPALAGEILVSAINSSQDTYDQSAGGTFMERKLIDWTAEQIGYNVNGSDGVFTAGGSQSNLMGLVMMRDCFSQKRYQHNIKTDGLPPEADRFRIFVSDKSHFSNLKNASIMGLGEKSIIKVPTDERFRMDIPLLKKYMKREEQMGNIPIGIVATAGTTDFGNVDPLDDIADIAEQYNIWMHVDAAYGCALLLSTKYRSLLNGIERADSVTIDYHKSFFQPISSSAFIVKNKRELLILKHHADYLNPKEMDEEEIPAQINKSITQSTRRFDALKLWFTLRMMGKEQLADYTDTVIDLTKDTAVMIAQDPDFELLSDSDLSVLVFRYTRPDIADTDALNQFIKMKLFYSGEILVASTRVNGNFYLKFTLLNPITTTEDIHQILTKIKTHGKDFSPEK
ncbi:MULTISPECIES: pyridoxal phosphate-dependent decarboxylase family protein [Chryseobacterium]|uniref:L-2,4-diaminobutyrate decarboxylase n=1 Tax=Chryseobacterium camelliae TaxID=1265445 RepID=A0ABU0THW9_9FLAO|nr:MULTISPECIES: aspartate aminotransferase family protein [Chryseobacterium]MDT3409480.1 L-2,4-diaminobutyrate decarboxylase [Pseudacidovorax intermedius]MDQ1096655.1 L-2,4-diaminobutyrate decarboxylase [Chryseobacterium camelliae]MDQ1100597.1 L-2,4-diaminobutyrate decarboxylase [Chryseobacterium sp. SORGH_AS_1048]MDR6087937.1 L-2,4-diaminobutyrate decarboxylase [Chryseobacterium sp. SORGH_AS_0909]MDR6132311.1 L-2,4-diaminobutyrate decarboxylase [Chryseobacterium sp. SORGH_AS_1175]